MLHDAPVKHCPTARAVHATLLVVVLGTLILLASACDKPKGEEGAGGQGNAAANENAGYEHVNPSKTKTVESEGEKAAKVARQLSNYLMPVAQGGAPETLDAAKEALKAQNVNWPKDPWGQAYAYKKTGDTSFQVYSLGPDKQDDTGDEIKP